MSDLKRNKFVVSNCDECMYYDYMDDSDEKSCQMHLDEDDREKYLRGQTATCPYYRYYNEYKSVQRLI